MTLSYSKFMLDGAERPSGDEFGVDIRCLVCGHAEESSSGFRLDDAIEWAESHQCAPLRVTSNRVKVDNRYPN